ncbi:prophage endopeptidase tail family protein [Lactiplantibacillus plantarum]|uniref:prophage endopeptidase tail family protein n=1 Tax=Lactiplantibacillus plantarum TaxID=1590 RepID=UPI002877378A|nr:prophage endopeptidase tail family protein [Lactiplantibacillus plantarum]WND29892.1 prophage endopeptidase tail family protein [Lactiplantibacillus plantarum]
MNKDNILLVKGLHSTNVEPLTTAVNSTVKLEWEKNGTYQLSFTAYAGLEDLVAYEMLDVESSIFFDGQEFVIKQSLAEVQDNFTTKQITATHVYNEISRIRQENVNSGEKTYTVDDVLSFYLKDNTLGFTWKVIGDFDNQQIIDLGGDSAKDCLSKITDVWSNAIIFPDNKVIQVYEQESFRKNLGGRIDYLHDANDIQLTSESTEIVNQVKAIGKEKDGSDSDKPSYYFDPFLVTDNNSVQKWGLHPGDDVSNNRFTDKEAMQKYVLSQMVAEPSLSISVTSEVNQKPIAGEVVRLEIRQMTFVTNVEVVGYTWYPFDKAQPNSITLNNNAKTILDYQRRNKNSLAKIIKDQKEASENGTNALNLASQAYDARMYGEVVGESEY